MVCSKVNSDAAHVAILTRSKFIVYNLTTEEEDFEEEGTPTANSFMRKEKSNSRFVVIKQELGRVVVTLVNLISYLVL